MRDAISSQHCRGALALFAAFALSACHSVPPCAEWACAVSECANPPSDACLDAIDSDPECGDGINTCAQCYLDNVADPCNLKPEDLEACREACGG